MTPHALAKRELLLSAPLPNDQHPAAVYLASLAKGSVPAQRSALTQIAKILGADMRALNWGALRYQHVQLIRARLQETYSATTANRLLTALRRVLKEAWKLGQISEEDYRKVADVAPIRGARDDTEEDLTGRALTIGELTALLAACAADETLAGTRDAAIIALGYGLGLRRAEASKLQLSEYDRAAGVVHVRGGKGNKSRTIPVDNGARDALDDWIAVRGKEPGRMFYGIGKNGQMNSRTLNVKAVAELFAKRVLQAGIKDATFHDLRRTWISDLLGQNVDLVTVSKLAGHSDPRTTAKYDRRKMDTRRRAIASLHVPYRRRSS